MPTMRDVLKARRIVAAHLPPTPSWSYPLLDEAVGRRLVVKHENAQPTGAFKVRGALNLLATLDEDIVTYSTGNHARAIAYAAREYGRHATIVMPEHAAPLKVRAVEALGAKVVLHGVNMADAEAHAQTLPGRLVSPGDEPALIAGVATLYLELFERHPDLDTLVVPVGSGTGAAAACLVAAAVAPHCRVIGVQSAASPAAHDSWRAGTCVQRGNHTRVDGLATGRGFAGPQEILRARLHDFVLVGDDEIDAARGVLARLAGTQAEGAGAAGLAAVRQRPDLLGATVGVVVTGANATELELAR
ncbi:pyridoxal-phosphate dependent enzyme [Dactylosporangium vinaceum]|uniref:Threonine/serine dehydratase n=1 Tax=Dactylosporangium vinaceum TaxID=53362 RepID=A0ABV5MIQ4_9ACTN|nr:pyridoxal-phosphate dependent enzyme [Dactylosporangium vinaceum]UAB93795.1 pyridoxal-phosphate dependent enzyme [Dactylosporangium vinaceum]